MLEANGAGFTRDDDISLRKIDDLTSLNYLLSGSLVY